MTTNEAIDLMKRQGSRLADPVPVEGMPSMTFSCSFSDVGASLNDFGVLPSKCPEHLREFWSNTRSARLFEDQTYGQWGLIIFEPQQAVAMTVRCRTERAPDFIEGDLTIGEFLGDSDLLLVRCDPTSNDFGFVMVALPLDSRSDWYCVAKSFEEFLNKFIQAKGEKYWTQQES